MALALPALPIPRPQAGKQIKNELLNRNAKRITRKDVERLLMEFGFLDASEDSVAGAGPVPEAVINALLSYELGLGLL